MKIGTLEGDAHSDMACSAQPPTPEAASTYTAWVCQNGGFGGYGLGFGGKGLGFRG
jgi:hypothetical protein